MCMTASAYTPVSAHCTDCLPQQRAFADCCMYHCMLLLYRNSCCCCRCRNNHKQSKDSGSGSSSSDSQSASYMGICKLNDSPDRVHRRIDIKVSATTTNCTSSTIMLNDCSIKLASTPVCTVVLLKQPFSYSSSGH
jgi:hypothetical protein